MKNVFFFDSMLTPKIITVVYWLMLLSVFTGFVTTLFSDYGGFLQALGILVFGSLGVRIWCELLIVLFKIHSNLQKIADRSE